jgi:uncharacterized protein (DUF697 family)
MMLEEGGKCRAAGVLHRDATPSMQANLPIHRAKNILTLRGAEPHLRNTLMARKSQTESLRGKLAVSLDSANQHASAASQLDPVETMSAIETVTAPIEPTERSRAAENLVNTSALLAVGAGAIPVPIWDLAALAAIQLKMIADVSKVYGVPFRENAGKSAVALLVGSLGPELLARGSIGVFLKTMPGIGSIVSMSAMPALAGGCTYAIGKVFIQHYESGGSLLTFNAKHFQATFTDEVKAGMKKVASIKI